MKFLQNVRKKEIVKLFRREKQIYKALDFSVLILAAGTWENYSQPRILYPAKLIYL